jgi:hypothetical protein
MLCGITLHLARSKQYPEGSTRRGYEILAPLDQKQQLDAQAWKELRDHCRVRRFWADERDQHGRLIHRAGGAGGATWAIDYDDRTVQDDEVGYRLGSHLFAPGEYVSIRDADEELRTFAVKAVQLLKVREPVSA